MTRQPWYVCPDLGPGGLPWLKIWYDPATAYHYFRLSDDAEFAIDERGRELWAVWPDSLREEEVIPVYVSGNMMSFILRLRGYACLHASAVEVDGRALLVAGQHGAGKSTIAAAFARRGFPVLSDDVCALKWHRGDVRVYPSFPRIGLWPASVEGILGADSDLPRLWPNEEKRFVSLGSENYAFASGPARLGAVYVMGDWLLAGDPPRIEPIAGAEAVLALLAHTFGVLRPENEARAAEFRLNVRAAKCPVRRVYRAAEFSQIDELCDAMLNDFRSILQGAARRAKSVSFRSREKRISNSAVPNLR
jgi:hypothetical protein